MLGKGMPWLMVFLTIKVIKEKNTKKVDECWGRKAKRHKRKTKGKKQKILLGGGTAKDIKEKQKAQN
jgi:hypothetical protein